MILKSFELNGSREQVQFWFQPRTSQLVATSCSKPGSNQRLCLTDRVRAKSQTTKNDGYGIEERLLHG